MSNELLPGTAERVRCMVEAEFGPGHWEGFQRYMCDSDPYHGKEWRFGGQLGTGGKVHLINGRLYVSGYAEDVTDDLRERLRRINDELRGLALASREVDRSEGSPQ